MMYKSISTSVDADMSVSTQATPPTPGGRVGGCGWGGGGRDSRGIQGGYPKQVSLPINCNSSSKAGHYVRDCTERKKYWYPPPSGTEDTDTKVYFKKVAKSDVTMSYCSVCKR